MLYKAHLLSFLEHRTPAIYHAKQEVLGRQDDVQRFLREANVDELLTLTQFNLALVTVRRDIAMLGVIHQAAITNTVSSSSMPEQIQDRAQGMTSVFVDADYYATGTEASYTLPKAWQWHSAFVGFRSRPQHQWAQHIST